MTPGRGITFLLVLALLLPFAGLAPVRAQNSAATPEAMPATSPVEFVWESRGGPDLPLDQPTSVTVDSRGNLWILDGQHGRFQIFSPDGAFLETWGEPGAGDGQFNFVRGDGFALGGRFDPDGNLYVADTGNLRIQKFDAHRQFVTTWGEHGDDDGQFIDPIGLGLGPDGRVYVVDDGRMDVQVFDADGAFLFTIGGPGTEDGTFVDIAGGVAVAPDGSIVTGDWGTNRIQRFAADGTFLAAWGGEGTGEGQFVEPVSVALDGEGHMYVSEFASDRVQKFRLLAPLAPAGTPTP